MRKLTVLSLIGLLILAFSATGYAQKLEFRASGFIDFDTIVAQNVPSYFPQVGTAGGRASGNIFQTWSLVPGAYTATPAMVLAGLVPASSAQPYGSRETGQWNRTGAYATSRAHLKFDAVMGPNLSGTIYFEIDAFRIGGSAAGSGAGVGAAGGYLTQAADKNNFAGWTTDKAAVEVKNIYIDIGLPYFGIPVPITLRVGAQPLGIRPNMMLYSDGAGITAGIKADPFMIIPMWAKQAEGADFAADDNDVYGLHVNAKVGTFTLGGYGLYYNMNTYPSAYGTGITWPSTAGAGTGSPTTFTTSSSYGVYAAGTQSSHMWWLGAYADGKLGPVNLNFDFVYDFGSAHERLTANIPDVRYQGWATRLKVDFPWEKFNFGVTGMYATGADYDRTGRDGIPGQPVASLNRPGKLSRRVNSFVLPPGSEQAPINGESLVVYSCFNAAADGGTGIANFASYTNLHRGGFGGTWFAKLYASVKPAPWYKLTLQGLYIGDTTKGGNTFGTAIKYVGLGATRYRDDNDIGWELDLINEIDIYRNLKGFVGFGYLWAGRALDIARVISPALIVFANQNAHTSNPWNFTTRLLYTF